MGFRIEDGKGRGNFVSVDGDNHLEVAAISLSKISSVADKGGAFGVMGRHTFQSTGATENILLVQNSNANKHVHIRSFIFGVETSTDVLATASFAATRTSGGTSKKPTQLNRGRADTSGIVVYDNSSNDLVLGVSLLEDFLETRFAAIETVQLDIADVVIIGPGNTVCFRGAGTAGDLITISAFVYEVGVE